MERTLKQEVVPSLNTSAVKKGLHPSDIIKDDLDESLDTHSSSSSVSDTFSSDDNLDEEAKKLLRPKSKEKK